MIFMSITAYAHNSLNLVPSHALVIVLRLNSYLCMDLSTVAAPAVVCHTYRSYNSSLLIFKLQYMATDVGYLGIVSKADKVSSSLLSPTNPDTIQDHYDIDERHCRCYSACGQSTGFLCEREEGRYPLEFDMVHRRKSQSR